ncbi:MAG: HAD family hydrolase [Myxococcales bacterium]|nr:HAD family hydrolase [Myxococcales bacterium]
MFVIEAIALGTAAVVGFKAWRARREGAKPAKVAPRRLDPALETPTEATPCPKLIDAPVMASSAGAVLSQAGSMLAAPALSLVSLPLIVVPAVPIFREAWHSVVKRRRAEFVVLDAGLVLLGIGIGAFSLGAAGVVVYLLPQRINSRRTWRLQHAKRRADEADRAWLEVNGAEVEVDGQALRFADIITVRAGERVPADGTIVDGRGQCDARPVHGRLALDLAQPGQPIVAGSRMTTGRIQMRVYQTGEATTASRFTAKPVPEETLERIGERSVRIANGTVAFTLLTTGLTALLHDRSAAVAAIGVNAAGAYRLTSAVLLDAWLARVGRAGFAVNDGRSFELLAGVSAILLDARALTEPERLVVGRVQATGDVSSARLLEAATHLLRTTGTPEAQALIESLLERGGGTAARLTVVEPAAGGFAGAVDGCPVAVRPPDEAERHEHGRWLNDVRRRGQTAWAVHIEGALAGFIAFCAPLREGAIEMVAALRRLHIETWLIGADDEDALAPLATALDISQVFSGVDADRKAGLIDVLRQRGHMIAYVGQSFADCPAMAAADLALTDGYAPPAVRARAHIVGPQVTHLAALIESARAYHRAQGKAITVALGTEMAGSFGAILFGYGVMTAMALQVVSLGAGLSFAARPGTLQPPETKTEEDAKIHAPSAGLAPAASR